jgi:anthranilate synthase component II
MKLYLLDNIDSFTYNLVDQFRRLGCEVIIYRNCVDADFIAERLLAETGPVSLVLSPGPGAPRDAGCMMALIDLVAGKVLWWQGRARAHCSARQGQPRCT